MNLDDIATSITEMSESKALELTKSRRKSRHTPKKKKGRKKKKERKSFGQIMKGMNKYQQEKLLRKLEKKKKGDKDENTN